MLKVGGLSLFNRHILPNEAIVCRGGILLVVLEIHVVLLGIDSISPPRVARWIKLPRRDQSEALQKDLLEADLMVSMRKLWLPWNDLPGHFIYYFTVLIATSHMGQTHIFCLLNFLEPQKNCRTAAVVQGYCSSGNAMKKAWGLWESNPWNRRCPCGSAGGCASISVKPVIPRLCAIPRLDVSAPGKLLLKADDVWAKKPGSGEWWAYSSRTQCVLKFTQQWVCTSNYKWSNWSRNHCHRDFYRLQWT